MNELYVAFCIVLIVCRRRHITHTREKSLNEIVGSRPHDTHIMTISAPHSTTRLTHDTRWNWIFVSRSLLRLPTRSASALYWFQSPKQSEKITLSSMARVRLALVINWNWRWSQRAVAGNWDNEWTADDVFSHRIESKEIKTNRKSPLILINITSTAGGFNALMDDNTIAEPAGLFTIEEKKRGRKNNCPRRRSPTLTRNWNHTVQPCPSLVDRHHEK